jgi:hypothetical protein
MSLPPRDVCIHCGQGVNLKSTHVMVKVTGWLKHKGSRSLAYLDENHFQYAHDWCHRGSLEVPDQDSLF